MTASIGREIRFYWGGESPADEIAGLRQKAVSLNGAPVETTSDEDNGWRTLLTLSGEDQVSIKISGVCKDRRLVTDWFAGNRTKPVRVEYKGGDAITGTFYLSTLSETGSYKEAVTFDAELVSSGIVSYTA